MSLKTIFELVSLVKLDGHAEFADPVRRYDELQSDSANRDYGLEVTRARNTVGKERTLRTHGGGEVTGVVTGGVVELWCYKTNGNGWVSERRIVGSDSERKIEGSRTVVPA